jgi:hypothetical protein
MNVECRDPLSENHRCGQNCSLEPQNMQRHLPELKWIGRTGKCSLDSQRIRVLAGHEMAIQPRVAHMILLLEIRHPGLELRREFDILHPKHEFTNKIIFVWRFHQIFSRFVPIQWISGRISKIGFWHLHNSPVIIMEPIDFWYSHLNNSPDTFG